MKVVVVGSNGQLGTDVLGAFSHAGEEVIGLTHSDIEIGNLDSVSGVLRGHRPDFVVNTAAMHHVEKCEAEPAKAFAANALGPRNLALVCRDIGAGLLHISTDYVFDGRKGAPYEETDLPLPLNTYGNTKVSGEQFALSILDRCFVLRTSALYGKSACRAKGGLNFIELMLKLSKEREEVRVVDDEFVTPTSTRELARQIVFLSRTDCYGLYHATAEGCCSWFEFARAIFDLAQATIKLTPALPGEFPAKVPRPKYSVLENCGLKRHRLNVFTFWRDGLREYCNG